MKCEECEIKDICKEAWCICGYCKELETKLDDNEECKCWNCSKDDCKFESRFKL